MKLSKQEKAARRAAFQKMEAKEKLDYILTYYKHYILLVLTALILLGSVVHHALTKKEAVFYLGLINVSIGDDLTFSLNKEYLDKTGTDFRKNEIVLYPGMYLSEDAATENHSYAYASRIKLLGAINSRKLDAVLMNREAYNLLSKSGFLADLSVLLSDNPTLLEQIQPYLTANEVVLSDNRIEYELNEADTREIISESAENGIDTSAFSLFKYAGFSDPVYFGIIANSPRTDRLLSFLSFLAAS